ncbi:MAG: 4-hydroxy-tetrahydrodipicolinate synthase [Gammaproteobacteria bacterium TMED30]|jgi:4-hydroxy-tetrahydrodipicolinate synthase|nr:4-hydroxy-tetrahydrodipicolinate synthase [Gammaproteobacteria bacterium]OUU00375.1 MAG: 4-hydroxy-tetrahydrodipicolinate synthase [Gammaproteobacteria bacterium TMED30]|tara:strand:- start:151 stop:1029 length:879 start_codon:yes stop_codon:yes gene_type:complete
MLTGSIVALVTPMQLDGSVDWGALDRLIEWHIESGTHGIVPMGTTGESATLATDEHLQVIKRTIDVVAGRVPVIAGTGSNATDEALHQTQEAQRLGADACLLVTPYYNRPTQEGLYQHYKTIAAATTVPIVLYNVPPRTGCDMHAETVVRLAELDGIVGVKEACGDVQRVPEIKDNVAEDFFVLSGEDAQTLQMLEFGAVGTISVTANVMPALMAEFCNSFLAGNRARAAEVDEWLQPVHEILFVESSPTPIKWALSDLGLIEAGIRLPLIPLSTQYHDTVRTRIAAAGAHA